MKISEHANYLLNEFGRLQFDYAAYCKPDGESLRNEARNNLETYIAELEAAQRWIPVSERLPEVGEEVFICDESGHRRVDWLVCKPIDGVGETLFYSAAYDYDTPTHWMPLPESPNDTQTETVVYGKVCDE